MSLEIKTTAGVVRGRAKDDLLLWRAIPFAAPPVGDLRLRAPQPHPGWSGVRDAVKDTPQAPQAGPGPSRLRGRMDEDCLVLNVTAPALPSDRPRPVMVWFHGGGYTIGTSKVGAYRGDHLARRGDVIVVSTNYRLGPLGFVDFTQWSTDARPIESNLGLRDQVAALEWVRDNIAAFGGDPDRVTIFGESAGGNSVVTLMATPSAGGLFHAAIAQSPPSGQFLTPEDARASAERVVARLGGPGRLLDAPAMDLVRAVEEVLAEDVEERPGTRDTANVVDGAFLPESPLDAALHGRLHRVPFVLGTNDREGLFFSRLWNIIANDPLRQELLFRRTSEEALQQVTAAYPGWPSKDAAIDVGGDHAFWWPTVLLAGRAAAHAPTWVYRYDYTPRLLKALRLGSTHAVEVPLVFGYGLGALGRLGDRSTVQAVSDRVQAHWLSVARTGVPLSSWPEHGSARRTLIIDAVDRIEDDPRRERRLAWERTLPQDV